MKIRTKYLIKPSIQNKMNGMRQSIVEDGKMIRYIELTIVILINLQKT